MSFSHSFFFFSIVLLHQSEKEERPLLKAFFPFHVSCDSFRGLRVTSVLLVHLVDLSDLAYTGSLSQESKLNGFKDSECFLVLPVSFLVFTLFSPSPPPPRPPQGQINGRQELLLLSFLCRSDSATDGGGGDPTDQPTHS